MNLLVYTPSSNNHISKAAKEALGLAQTFGGKIFALSNAASTDAFNFGADEILQCATVNPKMSADLWGLDFHAILLPSSEETKELAPQWAAKFGLPLFTEVQNMSATANGFSIHRWIMSGKALSKIETNDKKGIFLLRSGAFSINEVQKSGAIQILSDNPPQNATKQVIEIIQNIKSDHVSFADAQIIVSAGRGVKDAEGIALVQAFAHKIGAAVGGSRPTIESGLLDATQLVGQTGNVVSPTIYISIGMSGSLQHLAGMNNSKFIIAINKDASAQMMQIADVPIVADLYKILGEITG